MRIFIAGATGVIGQKLLPLLVADGHVVAGMTRSPDKVNLIEALGAEAVLCDVFEIKHLIAEMTKFKPDVVWHQLTDLPDDPALIPKFAPANNRIRREGTSNLLDASKAAGSSRFIAQSVAWHLPGDGGNAVEYLEKEVGLAGGVIVRYGQLYGPGTYYESDLPSHPRISIDRAAQRSLIALKMLTGVLTLCED